MSIYRFPRDVAMPVRFKPRRKMRPHEWARENLDRAIAVYDAVCGEGAHQGYRGLGVDVSALINLRDQPQ
jgi:hypothetical protein